MTKLDSDGDLTVEQYEKKYGKMPYDREYDDREYANYRKKEMGIIDCGQ